MYMYFDVNLIGGEVRGVGQEPCLQMHECVKLLAIRSVGNNVWVQK